MLDALWRQLETIMTCIKQHVTPKQIQLNSSSQASRIRAHKLQQQRNIDLNRDVRDTTDSENDDISNVSVSQSRQVDVPENIIISQQSNTSTSTGEVTCATNRTCVQREGNHIPHSHVINQRDGLDSNSSVLNVLDTSDRTPHKLSIDINHEDETNRTSIKHVQDENNIYSHTDNDDCICDIDLAPLRESSRSKDHTPLETTAIFVNSPKIDSSLSVDSQQHGVHVSKNSAKHSLSTTANLQKENRLAFESVHSPQPGPSGYIPNKSWTLDNPDQSKVCLQPTENVNIHKPSTPVKQLIRSISEGERKTPRRKR